MKFQTSKEKRLEFSQDVVSEPHTSNASGLDVEQSFLEVISGLNHRHWLFVNSVLHLLKWSLPLVLRCLNLGYWA